MGVNSCHWSVDVRNICLFVCLFLTLTLNAKGEIDRDTEQDLFKVTVAVVKPCSPDYPSASSDVSVHVCFGALSGGRERGE